MFSLLFHLIMLFLYFQGTSPEKETRFSPWLRQRLPQKRQWRADCEAHTSSQVNMTRIVHYHLSALPNRSYKPVCFHIIVILWFSSIPVKPWVHTGRYGGSTESRCWGWSRKWRPWWRVTTTRVEHQKQQGKTWSGNEKRLFCDASVEQQATLIFKCYQNAHVLMLKKKCI